MQSSLYRWLLQKIIPYIRFTTYYTSLRGVKYHQGYDLLREGDIIVTRDRLKLTTLLIPGYWAHAALCLGKHPNVAYEIAEMTHNGYTKSHFFDLCKEADEVAIYRCRDWDYTYILEVTKLCKSFEGSSYDLVFDLDVHALYCSELIYQADFEKRLKVDLTDLAGLGRQYISPDGLTLASNIDLIWKS